MAKMIVNAYTCRSCKGIFLTVLLSAGIPKYCCYCSSFMVDNADRELDFIMPDDFVSAYPQVPEKMDMTDATILSNRLYGKMGMNKRD